MSIISSMLWATAFLCLYTDLCDVIVLLHIIVHSAKINWLQNDWLKQKKKECKVKKDIRKYLERLLTMKKIWKGSKKDFKFMTTKNYEKYKTGSIKKTWNSIHDNEKNEWKRLKKRRIPNELEWTCVKNRCIYLVQFIVMYILCAHVFSVMSNNVILIVVFLFAWSVACTWQFQHSGHAEIPASATLHMASEPVPTTSSNEVSLIFNNWKLGVSAYFCCFMYQST